MNNLDYLKQVAEMIQHMPLRETDKNHLLANLQKMQNTRLNVLVTGATGSGKSSTINALFNMDKAKVGQRVDPETMCVEKFELNNLVLFDTPGLGDGREADLRHAKAIVDKLYELDEEGKPLIDLVLVILDGSSRDLGTSFELINQVIIPNLGENKNRLLVAINQADMAMKGRYWNQQTNQPEPILVEFLDEKVASTRKRIFEATGVEVEPIYYAAGYKDGEKNQMPYNLSKLMLFILRHLPEEKRVAVTADVNPDKKMWNDNDDLENYQTEIKKSLIQSVINGAMTGGKIGSKIGSCFGVVGEKIGYAVGMVVGGVLGAIFG